MGTSFEKDWQHIAKTVCLSKTSFGSETLWNLMYPLSSQGMAFWTNSNHIKVLLKILKINNKILVDFFFTFSVLSLRFWHSLTFQENLFLNYSFHALQSLMFHILTIFDYNMSRYLILLKNLFFRFVGNDVFSEFIIFFFFPLHFNDEDHRREIRFPF